MAAAAPHPKDAEPTPEGDAEFAEEYDGEEEVELDEPAAAAADRDRAQSVFRRLLSDSMGIRVGEVVIKGNTKTRDELIQAEVADLLHAAQSVQDLLRAASVATARLHRLDVFGAVKITLDAGAPERPGTTNVVIEVVEAANPLTFMADAYYSKPEERSWSSDQSLRLKNLFGYGDIWDFSGCYGWDQTRKFEVGVYLPRFKSIPIPLMARASLSAQDCLLGLSSGLSKMTHDLSYNPAWCALTDPSHASSKAIRRQLGDNLLSFGLLSTVNHDLSYSLTCRRTLTDPLCTSSKAIMGQFGHNLLSALKYTYKIDERDSHIRPTKGHAFQSTSQLGGLWDGRGLRFFRQEFNVCGAVPLGFSNAILNVGIGVDAILPIGRGFMNSSSPSLVPDSFCLGGHSSPAFRLSGLSSLLGFRTKGVRPTEARWLLPNESEIGSAAPSKREYLQGDMSMSVFADLSFDLPLKLFRDAGIQGHVFVTARNHAKLSKAEYRQSVSEFLRTFKSSTGVGIVLPINHFQVEVDYCHVVKGAAHQSGKSGIQFSFSSPSPV